MAMHFSYANNGMPEAGRAQLAQVWKLA